MTVGEYFRKHGLIATLKKLGQHDLAAKLELRQKLQKQALEEEGPDVPFEERRLAPEIQALDKYCTEADNVVWYRRNEKI